MISEGETQRAVLFFDQQRISREMLYPEFEAILDRVVPVTEYANLQAQAVFVRIDSTLKVTAAVFFLIQFDREGYPDSRWSVPLEQFADNSAKGPDLGAGPIRLACRSQCCITWHQNSLWDPDMTPGRNSFVALRKSIKQNRLGFQFKEKMPEPPLMTAHASPVLLTEEISSSLKHKYQQELRKRVAGLLKEQRLRISTISSKHKNDLHNLKVDQQRRLDELEEELHEKNRLLGEQAQQNLELKAVVQGQAEKIEGIREYFEHKLQSLKLGEENQLQDLKDHYLLEVQARVEVATSDLKEQLQMRDVEIMYRDERESNLKQEINHLTLDSQQLLENSGDQLLKKLIDKGISFVAYHPGAGHMTIPMEDLRGYLENPQKSVADHCGVSIQRYQEWLRHYRSPACQALDSRGEVCSCRVDRVESPTDFHAGESDRCIDHRTNITHNFSVVRA